MRVLQVIFACLIGASLFWLAEATDITFVLLAAAVLSLGTPRRFMWLTLAAWAAHFAVWSGFEAILLSKGDEMFGWMFIPYGVGAGVFGIAAASSFEKQRIAALPPPAGEGFYPRPRDNRR